MVIIGAKCLSSILQEMKQNNVDLNRLSARELGSLFNSCLSTGVGRKSADCVLSEPGDKLGLISGKGNRLGRNHEYFDEQL